MTSPLLRGESRLAPGTLRRIQVRPILAAATIAFACFHAASGQTAFTLVGTIDLPGVEGRIDHLAVDMAAQRLYVAALGNNTVEVLDLKSNSHVKSVPGFREPQGIVVLTDAKVVAVANGQGEGVQFIDASDYHPTKAVKLGDDSDNVRYDASAKRVYVGFGSGALAAVSPTEGKVISQVKLAGHPESFQLERSGSRIFVNVPTADHIAVVDRGAMKVIAAAVAEAKRVNAPGAVIAVVDDGGNLMALERLDNTFAAGANISIGKARTAAIFVRAKPSAKRD